MDGHAFAALAASLLLLLRTLAATASPPDEQAAPALPSPATTALEVAVGARALHDDPPQATTPASASGELDGPRRRREQWDMAGPALMLGGTLALLALAAVGHLASKALLASMLSAALSAVQLARQPGPNRPG